MDDAKLSTLAPSWQVNKKLEEKRKELPAPQKDAWACHMFIHIHTTCGKEHQYDHYAPQKPVVFGVRGCLP